MVEARVEVGKGLVVKVGLVKVGLELRSRACVCAALAALTFLMSNPPTASRNVDLDRPSEPPTTGPMNLKSSERRSGWSMPWFLTRKRLAMRIISAVEKGESG